MTLARRSNAPLFSIRLVFIVLSLLATMLSGTASLGQLKAPPPQQEQAQAPQSPTSKPQGSQPSSAPPPPNSHIVTVNFDYDFTKVPACSPKVHSTTCVKQFDVYDISGARQKLFSIPAPAGASGVVKGITGKSPRRVFKPGPHVIAVTAESATGAESEVTGSKITLIVPGSVPPSSKPLR